MLRNALAIFMPPAHPLHSIHILSILSAILHSRSLRLHSKPSYQFGSLDIIMLLPQTLAFLGTLVLLVGYLLYLTALPRPIAGIPYNQHSAERLLGIVPEVLNHYAKTGDAMSFLSQEMSKSSAPAIQLSVKVLHKRHIARGLFKS